MSDEPDENDPAPAPRASTMPALIRKFVFAAVLLLVVWLVFGQILPRYFFAHAPKTPVENAAVTGAPGNTGLQDIQNLLKEKDAAIAALAGRIDTLEAKLKAMEDLVAAAPPPPPPPPPPPLSPADMAPPPPPPVADDDRLARLEAKIEEQEESLKASRTAAARPLSVVAVCDLLKEAIGQGKPFAEPLGRLQTLAEGNAEAKALLAGLAPHAEKGVVTFDALKHDFETVTSALGAQESGPSLTANLRSLVRIRKVGEPQGADDQSVIARAETKLGRGDVDGTLKELAALSPYATQAFSGWIGAAEAYAAAHRAALALPAALLAVEQPAPENE